MMNKVKGMSSKIGKKVSDNKGKIAMVAGSVVLGAYGVFVYENVKGMEKLVVEGSKGTYELLSFRDGSQLLAGGKWGIISDEMIDIEAVMDAITHI